MICKIIPVLCLGILQAFASGMDGHAIFEKLNLDYPGLEKVKAAIAAKNFESGKTELLLYFRNRKNLTIPDYLFLYHKNQADDNASNIIDIKSIRHDFGAVIDWRLIQSDKEWQFSLNRMNWFQNYIGAYQKTSEEKYVKAWMDQVVSWINIGDPGYPRTIDSGRRLENWVTSFHMFIHELKSPMVTPDFTAGILMSMFEQAECLFNPDNWRRYSNWGTFENAGLAKFVIFFPEFKRQQNWLKEIYFRMRFQLENSFYPDGMHIEVSPSYHSHELEVWFDFLDLAELNQIQDPWHPQIPLTPVKELIQKRAEALMYWYKPNGRMPQVGDTDDSDERQFLRKIGEKWDRPDMLYVASGGKDGKAPGEISTGFPDGGYYILRGGWESDTTSFSEQLYLLFDTGLNQPWHAHFDLLNIVVSAYGHDLLIDPGRFTYNDGAERDYFKSTRAHNTIVIDGRDQASNLIPHTTRFYPFTDIDYVVGFYIHSSGITHKRSIFFKKPFYWIITDRLTGEGKHKFDQYWHLSDMALGKIKLNYNGPLIYTPHLLISSPFENDRPMIEPGFISPEYRVKKEVPVLQYSLGNTTPLVRPTVLYPFKSTPPQLEFEMIDVTFEGQITGEMTGPVALKISDARMSDIYFEQEHPGSICKFGKFETDARTVMISMDGEENIAGFHLIEGSYLQYQNEEIANFYRLPASVSAGQNRIEVKGECIARFDFRSDFKPIILLNNEQLDIVSQTNTISYRR